MTQVTINKETFNAQIICTGEYYSIQITDQKNEVIGFCGFGFFASKNKSKIEKQFNTFTTKYAA